MKEELLAYAEFRLSAPQYDEFCDALDNNPTISSATRTYWLDKAKYFLYCLHYSEYEIREFIGGL